MLFLPETAYQLFHTGRLGESIHGGISIRTKLFFQSWACFLVTVALLVHRFVRCSPREQHLLAKSIIPGLTGVVTCMILAIQDPVGFGGTRGGRNQFLSVLLIFLSSLLFYLWGLLEKVSIRFPPLRQTQTTLKPAFSFHGTCAIPFALLAIFYPNGLSALVKESTLNVQEILLSRCWGCFICIMASNASVATYYRHETQYAISRIMVFLFSLVTGLWAYIHLKVGLPSLELMVMPVFPLLAVSYLWCLLRKDESKKKVN